MLDMYRGGGRGLILIVALTTGIINNANLIFIGDNRKPAMKATCNFAFAVAYR